MFKIGDFAEVTKVISEEDVYLFAGITGDRNPLHTSKEYAAKTTLGERVAHEVLTVGLISAALGMKLPGPGSSYVSQTLQFLIPVRIGDEITARVEVIEVLPDRRVRLRTQCFNQRSEAVIEGEAVMTSASSEKRKETGHSTKKEKEK